MGAPVAVALTPRTILAFVLAVTAAFLLLASVYAARAVVVQLALAIVLALAAEPLVRLLERRGLGRGAAVGVSFAVASLLLIGIAYVLVAPIVERTRQLVHDAPHLLEELKAGRGPLGFLEVRFDVVERVQSTIDSHPGVATAAPLMHVIGSAVDTTGAIFFVLFLTLFVQLGGRQWYESVLALAPESGRVRIRRAGTGISEAVGGYVTGNLLISIIAGSVATLVLFALSVPYAVPLGLLVAIFDLVPLVGAAVGTVAVASVALATRGLTTMIVVVVALVLYQQLENRVLQQFVYHRTVDLSPLAIALSVAAGAELGGVAGALIGIPFAGALKVVAREVVAWRRGEDVPA
jgi:predicted PurR-regulated permease PerM